MSGSPINITNVGAQYEFYPDYTRTTNLATMFEWASMGITNVAVMVEYFEHHFPPLEQPPVPPPVERARRRRDVIFDYFGRREHPGLFLCTPNLNRVASLGIARKAKVTRSNFPKIREYPIANKA